MKTTGQKKGFTIVEIMTVVTIIGILGSIAVPNVLRAVQKAKIKKAETDLEMIAAAVKQLSWDTQKWPSKRAGAVGTLDLSNDGTKWDEVDLSTAPTNYIGLLANPTNGPTWISPFPNWKGPYMEEMPTDPWGNRYQFDPDYWLMGGTEVGNTQGNDHTYQNNQWGAVVLSYGPNKGTLNLYDNDDIWIRVGDVFTQP